MMMMMMMNCFCGMVDQQKAFSLISSRDHWQRSSPSRISDMPRAGFEPVQKLSLGFVEWSCAVVITTTPQHHFEHLQSRKSDWLQFKTFYLRNHVQDFILTHFTFCGRCDFTSMLKLWNRMWRLKKIVKSKLKRLLKLFLSNNFFSFEWFW